MRKYFKDSRGYFEFIDKYKEVYNILLVKPLRNLIRVDYERR